MASFSRISARLAALGIGIALFAKSAGAHAEDVSASGKGIVGGGLLGAEVVMLGEAAFHAKSGWAYLIGGVAGAGGGVALGYYAEQNADSKVSLYMFAGGVALVIPTVVAALSAAAYSPEDYVEERAPSGPVSEPPQPGTTPVAPPSAPITPSSALPVAPLRPVALHYHWYQPSLRLTPGLLAANDQGLRISVPQVDIRPVYTQTELAKYGLTQQQELRLTVFAANF